MRWTIKLEATTEWGETRTFDVVHLERRVAGLEAQDIGLKLHEAKTLLAELQRHIVQTQIDEKVMCRRVCADCLGVQSIRDQRSRVLQTLFGTVHVAAPRIRICSCVDTGPFHDLSFSPLSDILPDRCTSALLNVLRDPLVLDLDGDGVELTSLENSTVHFDYDGDGFAEATGWVSADDGLLVYDGNENGLVDGMGELFGSPTADGFAVLELHDINGDGKIDAADGGSFDKLRVWRDLDQDGEVDAGEMQTLEEAGIVSINLTPRIDVTGTNQGHDVGFESTFTRDDDTTGVAQTIYFQTDRQDTRADNTPNFTPAEGVDKLPQLPGSGQINSIAWKATQDASFKADWARRLAARRRQTQVA